MQLMNIFVLQEIFPMNLISLPRIIGAYFSFAWVIYEYKYKIVDQLRESCKKYYLFINLTTLK